MMSVESTKVAETTRKAVLHIGREFMVSPEMGEQEQAVGLPPRTLYMRGRSAVLGDPPAAVVTDLFGIFPPWVVRAALSTATPMLPAEDAVRAYSEVCWNWGREHLAEVVDAGLLADTVFRVVDAADGSGLPLFAGWRAAPRPNDGPARLAHALMVLRELRGGLHFAALRSVGLGVAEAVVADPEGGRERLLRTAWQPEVVDELVARAEQRADLRQRWQRAERLTDEATGVELARALGSDRLTELQDRLVGLFG